LLNKQRASLEVAGDLNQPLIEFYTCLRDQTQELLTRLEAVPYTQESFEWACEASSAPDPIDRATRFLVRNRFSRGGLSKSFAWSNRKRGGKPGDVNAWETIQQELPTDAARLQGVELRTADALELIEEFDRPDTLFYCDPPYVSATRVSKGAYACEMTDQAHVKLLDALANVRGMVVLSGYSCPLYEHALQAWEPIAFSMPNHSGQTRVKSRRIETVWLNKACDRFALEAR
jgi:DNA adenine methylase